MKQPMIVIHDFPHGARGLRVGWLCEEMGLPYAMKPVSFPTDSASRSLNPFGTVPFLQHGEISMTESIAMLFYVAQQYDMLLSNGDSRQTKVLQFTLFGEATLASPMSPLRRAKRSEAKLVGGRNRVPPQEQHSLFERSTRRPRIPRGSLADLGRHFRGHGTSDLNARSGSGSAPAIAAVLRADRRATGLQTRVGGACENLSHPPRPSELAPLPGMPRAQHARRQIADPCPV
jgi:hypothetical protein